MASVHGAPDYLLRGIPDFAVRIGGALAIPARWVSIYADIVPNYRICLVGPLLIEIHCGQHETNNRNER